MLRPSEEWYSCYNNNLIFSITVYISPIFDVLSFSYLNLYYISIIREGKRKKERGKDREIMIENRIDRLKAIKETERVRDNHISRRKEIRIQRVK